MLQSIKAIAPLALASLLVACGGSNSPTTMTTPDPVVVPPVVTEFQYQVTLSNLTSGQPFSPVALVLHNTGELWQIGQPASTALERLAEAGDGSDLLALDFVVSNATNGAGTLPGMISEVMIMTTDPMATKLSLAAMLGNTNDGFTGFSAVDLAGLEVGASMMLTTYAYDAGTEGNDELATTVPGPAAGGEGMNEARNDVNFVAMHPGVVSSDDGLSTSVLTGQQKFDNPPMSVKIQRIQ